LVRLEEIGKNSQIHGISGDGVVTIVAVEPIGDDAVTVFYRASDGSTGSMPSGTPAQPESANTAANVNLLMGFSS